MAAVLNIKKEEKVIQQNTLQYPQTAESPFPRTPQGVVQLRVPLVHFSDLEGGAECLPFAGLQTAAAASEAPQDGTPSHRGRPCVY